MHPQDRISAPLGWAFQKDSELIECFNYHLQKMIEAGILDNELRKTTPTDNKDYRHKNKILYHWSIVPSLDLDLYITSRFFNSCKVTFSGIDEAITLDYHNVSFPFAILILGLCAALVQGAIEAATRASRKTFGIANTKFAAFDGTKYEIQA